MNAARCTEPAKTLGHIGLTRTPLLKLSRENRLITTWPLLNKYCAYRYNYKGVFDALQAVLKRKDSYSQKYSSSFLYFMVFVHLNQVCHVKKRKKSSK